MWFNRIKGGVNIVDIDMEFRKGILFIRLLGMMNETNGNEVENMLREYIVEKGVKYIVLNLENVRMNSVHAYNLIVKSNSFIKINHGRLILIATDIKMPAFLKITLAENEYQAMNLITI